MRPLTQVLALYLISAVAALAGQNAAPSSHMVYNDASFEGDIVINEVRVPKHGEAMYTYYEALGWGGKAAGYAGIQAHPKAHNYIFSIWDHKQHTAPIKAVHRGPGTLTEKFGGEGTGLKSWNFELGWDTDVWYTLVSRCWPVGDHTFYGYWVRSDKTKQWTHMVTMDVGAKDAYFDGGNDSFIEDWLETGENARTTHIRNGWKRKRSGEWHAFGSARYSVNSWDLTEGKRSFNFRANWNGGVAKDAGGEFYFMTAGGKDTQSTTTNPSKHSIKRSGAKSPDYTAIKIQSGKAGAAGEHGVAVTWQNDATTLPQFSFTISAYDNPDGKGEPLAQMEKIEAHTRAAELALPKNIDPKSVHLRLTCRDILGNRSAVLPLRLAETAER
ncbi:MAG: DUF3472 domain-containing protein [Acidobacteria bacterium]|nr:DUF3472 domain-containing protein [Acidobacteriota bacterium]